MNPYIHIVLSIFIFVSIIYFYNQVNKKQYSNLFFLSKNELYEFLKADHDNYYSSFSLTDLQVRNANTVEEYVNNFQVSISEFDDNEKEKLKKVSEKADNLLRVFKKNHFDGKKASEILWKFCCVQGKEYENGLPHTRNNVIIVSKELIAGSTENSLLKIAIHEKVHVYQKLYPEETEMYLKDQRFEKLKKKHQDVRANPDTDGWIYSKNEETYEAVYKENPVSLEDVKISGGSFKFEHPFEEMAYEIEKLCDNQ
jgi:hypothetical protein